MRFGWCSRVRRSVRDLTSCSSVRAMCDRDSGATRKAFHEDEDVVLACMAPTSSDSDRRLVETEENNVKTRFPIGSSVVCLQPGTDSFGAGEQFAVDLKRKSVQLRLVTRPQLPPFGLIVKAVKDKYTSVRVLCRELKILYGVLLKITEVSSSRRHELQGSYGCRFELSCVR